jgi:endogenous inhibitor of DNA gyrase (YacG/DUF329 family)
VTDTFKSRHGGIQAADAVSRVAAGSDGLEYLGGNARMGDRDHNNQRQSPQRWQYTCPVCKRRLTAPRDPSRLPKFFPFCSERCKLIDLGAWLDAEYRIPSKPDEQAEHPASERSAADEEDADK